MKSFKRSLSRYKKLQKKDANYTDEIILFLIENDFLTFEKALELIEKKVKTKKIIISFCKLCGKKYKLRCEKLYNRTYKVDICGECYVPKFVTKQPEWKQNNSRAQFIAQNKPEQKKKNSDAVRNFWLTHPEIVKQVSEKMKFIYENDINYQNAVSGSKYKGTIINRFGKIYFHSLLELNFIIHCEVNNEVFKLTRWNEKGIEYYYDNKKRLYIPDFILNDNKIVEVKGGYYLFKDKEKIFLKSEACKNKFPNMIYSIITEEDIGSIRLKNIKTNGIIKFYAEKVQEEYLNEIKK
jgi:hypothetical protein